MLKNRQIAPIEGKCRQFRNSSDYLKTHCAASFWPIWTQKGAKRSVKMRATNLCKSLFKNIVLCMNGSLSKNRSVHSYVVPRTVYFDWICITLTCILFKRTSDLLPGYLWTQSTLNWCWIKHYLNVSFGLWHWIEHYFVGINGTIWCFFNAH